MSYQVPRKAILSKEQLQYFQESKTHQDIVSYIETLNDAVIGSKLTDDCSMSNNSKSFHDGLPNLPSESIPEISVYFNESWGNRTRIDYGSGMELNFLCWLICLERLGVLQESDHKAIVLKIFWRYIQVMRILQSTYWLEPAGSHGVWGLDDYHFLPFLFGSAQLRGHKYIRPKAIHDAEIVEEYSQHYMYFACIAFINSIKTASLRWHSPMLDDISAVKTWDKVNSGMIKMYLAEVLGKLPVIQHFLFGSILTYDGPETPRSDASQDDAHRGHAHADLGGAGQREVGWGDCCGIPVPSVFASAQIDKEPGFKLASPGIRPCAELPFHGNRDILDEIFEYLALEDGVNSEDARSGRRKLRSLAVMCKAFLEPALDQLWRSLESLFPLLNILPAFQESDGTYVLRGAVSPEEWARFDWYARRVRKFTYTRDPPQLDIAMHTYFRLAQLHSAPILPSLRHLHCPVTNQGDFLISGICLFLTPSLQSLEFEVITSVEDKLCGTVFHTLIADGAQMQKIILRGKGLSRDTISMAIQFQHLRELEVEGMGDALDMDILERIGALPSLVDLAIDFTDANIPPLDKDIGMKDLKSFMITASVPFIRAFLPRIASQDLETFVAVSPSNPGVNKKDFIEEVVSRWKDTLVRVALVHKPAALDEVVEELNTSVFSPLLPLRKLTYLRLEGYSMEITDADIGNFARAWPEMTTLLLPFINAGRPRPTVESLRTLSQLAPKLRYLRIPLQTSNLRFNPNHHQAPAVEPEPGHNLHTLTVASSDEPWELREVLHLARYIDHFFPNLVFLLPFCGADAERWMQVHDIIQMYQTVRQEAIGSERGKRQIAMT
ncbi:hypothetical protein CVT25_002321 [Psilocybe cyanescens]|uniref:peptidylprolyl isomerase n=1 Tax=Psilocybe cyanescens TaxID=93625 RepID=A0A409WKJ4_PSICY|nr:hypothetical protein CVT25_002321 [Psilocybe cyanescens]